MAPHRVDPHDDEPATFERIRRTLGASHDYAMNRGALKGWRGSATGRRRYRHRRRRVAPAEIPKTLRRLLGL